MRREVVPAPARDEFDGRELGQVVGERLQRGAHRRDDDERMPRTGLRPFVHAAQRIEPSADGLGARRESLVRQRLPRGELEHLGITQVRRERGAQRLALTARRGDREQRGREPGLGATGEQACEQRRVEPRRRREVGVAQGLSECDVDRGGARKRREQALEVHPTSLRAASDTPARRWHDGLPAAPGCGIRRRLPIRWAPHVTPQEASRMIIAAADGSALGNPGPAGWAWYVDDDCWSAGGWKHATNNMGELKAVLELFRATELVDDELLVLCDSQYVINAVTKWMPGWKRKGWRKADGKPVMNLELLQQLDEALAGRRYRFEWVKGHVGHPLNEAADERARAVAESYQRGSIAIPSGPGWTGGATATVATSDRRRPRRRGIRRRPRGRQRRRSRAVPDRRHGTAVAHDHGRALDRRARPARAAGPGRGHLARRAPARPDLRSRRRLRPASGTAAARPRCPRSRRLRRRPRHPTADSAVRRARSTRSP